MCRGGLAEHGDEVRVAARRAVDHMVVKGFQHEECYWRHVGLYRGQNGELGAVLVDLGNVIDIDPTVPAEAAAARQAMLEQLGLQAE
jgi:hypothetical protein